MNSSWKTMVTLLLLAVFTRESGLCANGAEPAAPTRRVNEADLLAPFSTTEVVLLKAARGFESRHFPDGGYPRNAADELLPVDPAELRKQVNDRRSIWVKALNGEDGYSLRSYNMYQVCLVHTNYEKMGANGLEFSEWLLLFSRRDAKAITESLTQPSVGRQSTGNANIVAGPSWDLGGFDNPTPERINAATQHLEEMKKIAASGHPTRDDIRLADKWTNEMPRMATRFETASFYDRADELRKSIRRQYAALLHEGLSAADLALIRAAETRHIENPSGGDMFEAWIMRPDDLPVDDFDTKEGLQAAIAWRRQVWEKAYQKRDGYELRSFGSEIAVIRHDVDVLGKNRLKFEVQPLELSREAAAVVNASLKDVP